MEYKIYQIKNNEELMQKFLFNSYNKDVFDINNYDVVYETIDDCKDLEDIFTKYNIAHPQDFRGHSLSISDVVEIINSDTVELGLYYCDSFSWEKIN